MRVVLGVVAKEELFEIQQWIARRNARSARRWRQTILRRISLLADAPFSGRRVAEQPDENLREVVVGPYQIAYRVETDHVLVLRVWDARRGALPNFLGEPDSEYLAF